MPYPTEHSARISEPEQYKRIRRENGKFGPGIDAIWGIKEDNKVEIQAIRFDKSKYSPEEAKKWLSEHNYKPIDFEPAEASKMTMGKTYTLEMPILRPGNWQGLGMKAKEPYRDEDVKEIMDNTNKLIESGEIKPFLKLGHNENQSLLKNSGYVDKDGNPAIGWVAKLKMIGGVLKAIIEHVPKTIYNLIMNRAYQGRSVEFFKNYDPERGIGKVLRAVALLGADIPAVSNLGDIEALYTMGLEIDMFAENEKETNIIEFSDAEEKLENEMYSIKDIEIFDSKLAERLKKYKCEKLKLNLEIVSLEELLDTKEGMAKIMNPALFDPDSFRYYIKEEHPEGIRQVIGKLKDSEEIKIQSYIFNPDKFNSDEVKEWLKQNNIDYSGFVPGVVKNTRGGEKNMDELEKLKKDVSDLTGKVTTLEAENKTLKEEKTNLAKMQADEKEVALKTDVESFVAGLITDGKILPAEKDLTLSIFMDAGHSTDMIKLADGKEVAKLEALKESYKNKPKVVNLSESSLIDKDNITARAEENGVPVAHSKLDTEIKKYMKERNITDYHIAFQKFSQEFDISKFEDAE